MLRKPTTMIESSPGNFQYAYRLSRPFTNTDDAREFITNLYSMGSWDGGGAVAAKFIRLPCGINGKMKDGHEIPGKTDFRVRLVEVNPAFAAIDRVEAAPWGEFGEKGKLDGAAFGVAVENFHMTDPISRASETMATCAEALESGRSGRAGGATGTDG